MAAMPNNSIKLLTALFAAGAISAGAGFGATAPAPRDVPLLGAIAEGSLYACVKRAREQDLLLREGCAQVAARGCEARPSATSRQERRSAFAFPHWFDFFGGTLGVGPFIDKLDPDRYSLCFHLRKGLLFYVGGYSAGGEHFPIMREPLSWIEFSDNPTSKVVSDSLRLPAHLWPKAKPNNELPTGLTAALEYSYYFPWVAAKSYPLTASASQEVSARFDISPESDDSLLAIINVQAGRQPQMFVPTLRQPTILVFRYRFDAFYDRDKKRMFWSGLWTEADEFESQFLEPFRAVVKDASYFFVTQSGSMYESSRARADDRRMHIRWDATTRKPVVAMIENGDADKTYAFTVDEFFEIGPDLRRQPCNIGPASDIKPDDPMPTLRRCAQTLIQRGLLKVPHDKEPPARPDK